MTGLATADGGVAAEEDFGPPTISPADSPPAHAESRELPHAVGELHSSAGSRLLQTWGFSTIRPFFDGLFLARSEDAALAAGDIIDAEKEPEALAHLGGLMPFWEACGLFAGCAASGALIWFASPRLFGQREPWDAAFPYTLYLAAAGVIAGLISPKSLWPSPLGFLFGQAIGLFALPKWGVLVPIGFLVFVPMTSLVSLIGALLGASIASGLTAGGLTADNHAGQEDPVATSVVDPPPSISPEPAVDSCPLPPEISIWSDAEPRGQIRTIRRMSDCP